MKLFMIAFFCGIAVLIGAPALCFSQQVGDKKIIITISDTADIYNRCRIALGKNDYIIKEDGNRDTISTHPLESHKVYSHLTAVISGKTVTLFGFYSLMRMDDFGYTRKSNGQKPIVYYKGSKTWQKLHSVALVLGGEISYSK